MNQRNKWSIVFLLFILSLGVYVRFQNDETRDFVFNVFRKNYDYDRDFYLLIDGNLSETPVKDMEEITSNIINVRPKMDIIIESDSLIVYKSPFFTAHLNYHKTSKLQFKSAEFYTTNKTYCEN